MATAAVRTIVLVHGAFADGSSWAKIIPPLQQAGYKVLAVQNPLTSLADDVLVVNRALESVKGEDVLLAGHSYGGAVITEAGNSPQVAGLVYVAAGAPDSGQSFNDWWKPYPPSPITSQLGVYSSAAGGFVAGTEKGIQESFAQDVSASEQGVIYATQGPLGAHTFDDKVSHAAWRDKPSWYIVAENDRTIPPQAEIDSARNIKPVATLSLQSSHVPMLSHPDKVAQFILQAAKTLNKDSASIESKRGE